MSPRSFDHGDMLVGNDPFVVAWGELESWRGAPHQSQLISGLSHDLLDYAPCQSLKASRAIGQSQALHHHLLVQVDRLTPRLRLPGLHRSLSALRSARRGPMMWRRHWRRRAISYPILITEEQHQLALAGCEVSAWLRAISLAKLGVEGELKQIWPADMPEIAKSDYTSVQAQLGNCLALLKQLETEVSSMKNGVDCLRRKIECLIEATHASPDDTSDVLSSSWFDAAFERLVAMPPSGIRGSRE